jgi:hypothetical protein
MIVLQHEKNTHVIHMRYLTREYDIFKYIIMGAAHPPEPNAYWSFGKKKLFHIFYF